MKKWKKQRIFGTACKKCGINELTNSSRLSIIILKGGTVMELTKSEMQIMDVLWASDVPLSDRKSTRLNSSHVKRSRMPSSA